MVPRISGLDRRLDRRRRHRKDAGRHDHQLEQGGAAHLRIYPERGHRTADLDPHPARPADGSRRSSAAARGERIDHNLTKRARRNGSDRCVRTISPVRENKPDHRCVRDRARRHCGTGPCEMHPPPRGFISSPHTSCRTPSPPCTRGFSSSSAPRAQRPRGRRHSNGTSLWCARPRTVREPLDRLLPISRINRTAPARARDHRRRAMIESSRRCARERPVVDRCGRAPSGELQDADGVRIEEVSSTSSTTR